MSTSMSSSPLFGKVIGETASTDDGKKEVNKLPIESYSEGLNVKPESYVRVFNFPCVNVELRWLKGNILTIIDATISDPVQRKAVKDLIRNSFITTFDNFETLLREGDEEDRRVYEVLAREAPMSQEAIHA